jgi:hypothetical protein
MSNDDLGAHGIKERAAQIAQDRAWLVRFAVNQAVQRQAIRFAGVDAVLIGQARFATRAKGVFTQCGTLRPIQKDLERRRALPGAGGWRGPISLLTPFALPATLLPFLVSRQSVVKA